MAKLPAFARVRREDLGKDVPEWVDRIVTPFNNAIEAIYLALNAQIAANNLRCVVQTVAVRPEKLPITIPWNYTEAPIGVIVLKGRVRDVSVSGASAVPYAPDWTWGHGSVKITALQGFTEADYYDLTIMVF